MKDFFNPYSHCFVRLGVATPLVRVGDPKYNLEATLGLMRQAARDKVSLVVFPELGLSAYTCEDLFHQQALLDSVEDALRQLLAQSRQLRLAALVGYLNHDNLAVRELAALNLAVLAPEAAKAIAYDPDGPPAARQKAVDEWKQKGPAALKQ